MANYLAPDPIQSTFFIPGTNTPGNGVQVFFYAAGTTTKQTAYQDSSTSTAWSNPIVLDSGGNLPTGSKEVWLVGGQTYKAVYAPSNDTDPPVSPYRTADNLSGVNDPSGISTNTEWIAGTTPTFVSASSFSVVGDQTTVYTKGRRIKAIVTAGTIYATVINATFSINATTVTISGGVLDSGLSIASYGLLDPANPSISFYEISRKSSTTIPASTTTDIWSVDGNSVHLTGTTTIASFSSAPYAGAVKKVIFDSMVGLTPNASTLVLPGGVAMTTYAGEIMSIYADTATKMVANSFARIPFIATEVVSTTGTAIDFTNIPTWANVIVIGFSGVQLSSSTPMDIRIGDAGGIETAGYLGCVAQITNGATPTTELTSGSWRTSSASSTAVFNGNVTLSKHSTDGAKWTCKGVLLRSDTAVLDIFGGEKTLSPGPLDRVRILSDNGLATFSSGSLNITYF